MNKDETELRLDMDKALTMLRMHFSLHHKVSQQGDFVTIRLTVPQWDELANTLSTSKRS